MNVELEVDHKESSYKCSYLYAKGCGEVLLQATVGMKNDNSAVKIKYLFCPACGYKTFTSCIWLEEGD